MPYHDSSRNLQCRKNYKLKVKLRCREYILQYLLLHPCIRCGEKDPVVLSFHHINPKEKRASISDMVSKLFLGLNAVIKEINKCEILCANCHVREHKENGWS
jgi:hypothetical protein